MCNYYYSILICFTAELIGKFPLYIGNGWLLGLHQNVPAESLPPLFLMFIPFAALCGRRAQKNYLGRILIQKR